MTDTNATIAVYDTHTAAENAVKELQKSGFDMKKLSVVGKDFRTDEQVVGYYNAGDRMKYWGKMGAFWGGLWGLLVGAAFFWVPGVGPLLVAGPLAAWVVGALGGCGGRRRIERDRRRPLQHRYTEGQCREIRDSDKGGQVSPSRPWDCGGNCESQRHPGHYAASRTESAHAGTCQAGGKSLKLRRPYGALALAAFSCVGCVGWVGKTRTCHFFVANAATHPSTTKSRLANPIGE